ncbi:MAG: chemotaxis protein CheB [Syntrophobacteraceae bacterium]
MTSDADKNDRSPLGATEPASIGDQPDNHAPSDEAPTYYVGIGASAGGLEAIEQFFTNMPPRSGLTFVVIQHLSPHYKSLMVELLSKRTEMPVYRAEEGLLVKRDCVYLIPPTKNLMIFHGRLLLSEQDHTKGLNLPIDVFLRSLAEDQGERAIGIILSGTGSDGMRGIRTIKEAGGMVMVQDPESAKFDGMPRSSLSTGLADFVLPPEEMPSRLTSFVKHPYVSESERPETLRPDEDGLTRIFALIREKTKVDFTYYKPSTVIRRIERRMLVNQIDSLADYVKYMESYSVEIVSLYRELLIGVTSFFRDRGVFDLLESKWLRELMAGVGGRELRLWIPGCSTGEEAYSLAILCQEIMDNLQQWPNIKIFATDVDRDAVLHAGNGIYPESIAADLSPRLLARYFSHRGDSFQISRRIREMVVFAQHNLIKDPPFTNIDFVSCRNLLIYLQPVLQRKVLELFNFSLNTGGLLLLGISESTGEVSDQFEPLDHKWKIYRSRGKRKPVGIGPEAYNLSSMQGRLGRSYRGHGVSGARPHEEERILDRFLQAMTMEYIPFTLIVNEQFELVYVLGDSTGYFTLPSGRMQNDVTKMAVKDLAIPLATGLQKAFKNAEEVRCSVMRLRVQNEVRSVEMRMKPLPEKRGQERLVAVLLAELPTRADKLAEPSLEGVSYDIGKEAEQRILDLEQELQFTGENLQATIEELEASNEELQAANEELLASNEELQSTNEELQSVNEELHTVNSEFQSKILELTELNNDIDNLLTSARIGAIFLDENLEIRKSTPLVRRIFNILDSDTGRPFRHLKHPIKDIDLEELARQVRETSKLEEREIQTEDGSWHLVRVLPYHIGLQLFSGVVLTMIDITQLKKAQGVLRSNQELFQKLIDYSAAVITIKDPSGRYLLVNRRLQEMLDIPPDAFVGKTARELFPADVAEEQIRTDGEVLAEGKPIEFSGFLPVREGSVCFRWTKFPVYEVNGALFAIGAIGTEAPARTCDPDGGSL